MNLLIVALEHTIVRTKNQKSRLVLTVQAFCEEKGLRSLSGVVGYAESKNQCWQVEKWLFIDLICIFSRWPPKTMELVLYRLNIRVLLVLDY